EHGTGSGRRTIPTTRSPFLNALLGPGSWTRPKDSCPSTSRVLPGGGQPYLPSTISISVPQTPTATPSTTIDPSRGSGSGTSSYRALPDFNGSTVIAFIGHWSSLFTKRKSTVELRLASLETPWFLNLTLGALVSFHAGAM